MGGAQDGLPGPFVQRGVAHRSPKIITDSGKPLKEAVPFTVELVKAMGSYVVDSAFEAVH